MAHIHAVHQNAAPGDVIEAGDELAQGGLAAPGGAHHRHRLPLRDVDGYVVQHGLPVLVGEGHVVHQNVALGGVHVHGVGGVLHRRLHPHQLHKPLEACHAVEELLHKGGQLAHGGEEGGDIQSEGNEVNVVHLTLEDEPAACGDGEHVHGGQGELQPRHIGGHGLVVVPLGPLELVVGLLELPILLLLVGEGLGGAHAGDGGLQLAVDARHVLLDLHRGLHHPPTLEDGEDHKQGHHGKDDKGQLPLDGEHQAEGAAQSDHRDEQVFGAVVGQLGDLEQVGGGPAHQLAGAVFVIEGEGQILHVSKQVPADVRLNEHAHHVAQIGDDVVHPRPQQIGRQQTAHDPEEGPKQVLGQQLLHGQPGQVGESQVNQGDAQRTGHIQQKQVQVWLVVGQKDRHMASLKFHTIHDHSSH